MLNIFGLDIAKRVFQLHTVDLDTGEIRRIKLRRAEMIPYFANHAPCVVAMKACGSSHHWGRQLRSLGHEVRLIATKFVKPFVKNNKTDAADAQAIWEAAQRPGNGRRLKCLTVADDFSHEAVDIAVDYGISGQYVIRLLDQAARFRGYPAAVRTDNGPEFTSRAFIGWAQSHGIRHLLIEPGGPCRTATSRASMAASATSA